MKATPSLGALLTVQEVASHLRVDEKTVRRWIKARELPAIRLGRQWRVREADLVRFLTNRWRG